MDEFLVHKHMSSIIVSNCQQCNDQHLHTPPDALYMVFTVINLELFIQVLFLEHVLVQEKNYAYASRASCYVLPWMCHLGLSIVKLIYITHIRQSLCGYASFFVQKSGL